ncbi:MAG: hypothetical protein Kow0025_16860 [Thermodesulfovibrionales bacterium]
MQAYRFQEILYLVVPVILGIEFFATSRAEKKEDEEATLGGYILDFCGYIFAVLVPAIFIFTIWAIEFKAFPSSEHALARLDRYGVMFFFLGSWWQVYMITALRARRWQGGGRPLYLWGPFLGLGIFISVLVLWISPWNLKWISIIWFLALAAALHFLKARPRTVQRVMWVLVVITFLAENVVFLWLESVA